MSEYFLRDETTPEPEENPPAKPGHSTGPTSPEGKERSSMNRLIHGCRSEKHVLPDEDPEEFAFVVRSWFESYHPADDIAEMLVTETALAHWRFKRNSQRLAEIECRVPGDAWLWTPEHLKLFGIFLRYKTTTESKFRRWFTDLESHYDRLHRREHLDKLAQNKRAAIETKWLETQLNKPAEYLKATQYVTVENLPNAPARTSCSPGNEEILARAAQSSPKPAMVERVINFPQGVPAEYNWLAPNSIQKLVDCWAVQRMFYEDWLELTELEKAAATGHISTLAFLRPESS